MVTKHKTPQFTGLKSGTGGMPDAPLNYLEANVGAPASSKRPTTREPAGPTIKRNTVRQTHGKGTLNNGE